MLHARIVSPTPRTREVVAALRDDPGVVNLAVFEGASIKPRGDIVLCDVARERANAVMDLLHRLGVDRDGAISADEVDFVVSEGARRALRAQRGRDVDAIVWAELASKIHTDEVPSISFAVLMVLAGLLAGAAVLLDSPVLVVGAMIVSPDFGPIAALAVGLRQRDHDRIVRSAVTLTGGLGLAIAAAAALGVVVRATGIDAPVLDVSRERLTGFIFQVDFWSVLVAVVAGGAATVLLVSQTRAAGVVGVFVSVVTIPAAAATGVSAAFSEWSASGRALLQLATNIAGLTVSVVASLALLQAVSRRMAAARSEDR